MLFLRIGQTVSIFVSYDGPLTSIKTHIYVPHDDGFVPNVRWSATPVRFARVKLMSRTNDGSVFLSYQKNYLVCAEPDPASLTILPVLTSLVCCLRSTVRFFACHVRAFGREELPDPFTDVVYDVQPTDVIKPEPNVLYAPIIKFFTPSTDAACGVTLDINAEYLLDLRRRESTGQLWTYLCGMTQPWDQLSDGELEILERGCGPVKQECDCGEFQVGLGETLMRRYSSLAMFLFGLA